MTAGSGTAIVAALFIVNTLRRMVARMSSNASKWFFEQPENKPFFVTERINGTFWNARIVDIYWRCTRAEAPLQAEGYGDHLVFHLEWEPGQWLKLSGLDTEALTDLADAMNRRIMGFSAAFTYEDYDGNRVYEWHRDGGNDRWGDLQGRAEFVRPTRL